MANEASLVNVKAEIITEETKAADQKVVADFYGQIPLLKRLESVKSEQILYFRAQQNAELHEKCLPEYCYNIFEKFGRTHLSLFPRLDETITGDIAGLKDCKTVEEAKHLVQIDWVRLGRGLGILIRGQRFASLEWDGKLRREGLLGRLVQIKNSGWLVDASKVPENQAGSDMLDVGKLFDQGLRGDTCAYFEGLPAKIEYYARYAYEWSCEAMADLCTGIASGLTDFLDEGGEAKGVNNRENLYWFLLIAWPEIKEMLESEPRKTVTDLYEWMLPFSRERIAGKVTLELLRNVCTPPPSGIGLALRPFRSRRNKSSA